VRTTEELNKEVILQDREKFTAEEWAAVGVKIGQEKSLTITPKAGEVDKARMAA
jgi:phage host-nuclease inhibitor protein Gam